MNICNPSLVINVAGIQNLRTGLWFGVLGPAFLPSAGVTLPIIGPGQQFGGLGLLTISGNTVIVSATGVVSVSFGAQLTNAADVTSTLALAFESDGPGVYRATVPFVRTMASGFYAGPIASDDVITVVGLSSGTNQQVISGTLGIRVDLYS